MRVTADGSDVLGMEYDQASLKSAWDLAKPQLANGALADPGLQKLIEEQFLPLLRASEHPRIVNVSSEAASLAGMGGGTPAYTASKVALNALTRMLAAELRRDHVLVNAVCPGWVATDMGGPGGRPVEAGAASVVWAATLPDSGPTGGFFRDGHPLPW